MENLLLKAFETSLIANNESLREANAYLESIKSHEQVIPSCLSIALSNYPLEIRQLSVIYLKNLTKVWKDSRREYPISESDKQFLKLNILKCLLFSIPDKIRVQFEEIAFNIAKVDFPWDNLLMQIDEFLRSANADQIFAALCMINQISKVYEQVLNERRNNLKIIVSRYFGQLGTLLEGLLREENEQKFRYISLILQIYWTCFYSDLPEEQATVQALQGWLEKCKVVLEMNMAELAAPVLTDDEAVMRDENPKWQCKRWAAQILHRLFNRYFNLAYLKDHQKFVGQYFQANWVVPLTELALNMLIGLQNSYMPNSVSNYLLKFVTQAVKLNTTCEILHKYSRELILLVILPLLNRRQSDEEMWLNNPIEYIRRENDIGKAYFSSKSSAVDLLKVMCETSCLQYFMGIVVDNLQNSPSLLIKESLFYALGALNKVIKTEKSYLPSIENILYTYALPEFTSPAGVLRSRVCFLYSNYTDISFTIPGHEEQVLLSVCKLMMDTDLPVRIEAATSLPKLLSWDISKSKIRMEIQNVLTIYLELMNQIDFEDLVEALEDIIGSFSSEITPFAIEFSKHLAKAFMSIVNKENNDESVLAAVSTLNTLSKLVDTLDDRPEDLFKISVDLLPIFDFVFSKQTYDYFEACLTLLTSLLYYCPSNYLQHLFKYASLLANYIIDYNNNRIRDSARDSIEEVFTPFANYLKKYRALAKENVSVFLKVGSVLAMDGYQETVTGCKIFMAVLENLQLDYEIITQVLLNSYTVFTSQESKKMKMLFIQIAFVSLWRAPQFTLSYFKNLACVNSVFSFICQNDLMIKEEIPLAQALLGLSSMIAAYNDLGDVTQWLVAMFKILLKLFKRFSSKNNEDEFKSEESEHMNMLSKLKMMQGAEEEFDECGDELYESVFETLDPKSFVKACVIKSAAFVSTIELTSEELEIYNSLIN